MLRQFVNETQLNGEELESLNGEFLIEENRRLVEENKLVDIVKRPYTCFEDFNRVDGRLVRVLIRSDLRVSTETINEIIEKIEWDGGAAGLTTHMTVDDIYEHVWRFMMMREWERFVAELQKPRYANDSQVMVDVSTRSSPYNPILFHRESRESHGRERGFYIDKWYRFVDYDEE